MPQQTGFDMSEREERVQQRIVLQINLSNGKVVGGAPISLHFSEKIGRQDV
jgi:hypothetical protein